MKRILALVIVAILALSAIIIPASAAEIDTTKPVAEAAYGTPVIDGTIDEVWAKATVNKLGNYDYVKKETSDKDPGQFRVLWDEAYLYILFEINDATSCGRDVELKDTNWYARDGVSITFTPNYDRSTTTTQVAPSFWAILRRYGTAANYNQCPLGTFITEQTVSAVDGSALATGDSNNFDKITERMFVTADVSNAAGELTGYVIEAKFNLKLKDSTFTLEPGKLIGFDCCTNDNVDTSKAGRNSGFGWFNADGIAYKNNAAKGTIVLLAKEPETADNGNVAAFTAVAVCCAVAVTTIGTAIIVKRRKEN